MSSLTATEKQVLEVMENFWEVADALESTVLNSRALGDLMDAQTDGVFNHIPHPVIQQLLHGFVYQMEILRRSTGPLRNSMHEAEGEWSEDAV